MEPGEVHPATGDDFTHTVHYGGQSFGVLADHAQLIAKAIADAANGTVRPIKMNVTQWDTGATVQRIFLIGPAIPILLEGPPN